MARRLTMIGLGLACATLVGGCANVPTSGPVELGDEIDIANEGPQVRADFPAPLPGWSQTEIVKGYVDAMSQYEDGYEMAQKFLTADAKETWAPTSEITITDGRPKQTIIDDKTVELSYELVATLGPDSSYLAAPTGHTDKITVNLSKLSGEWRISKPPEGLIMSKADFDREFEVFNTYFFDPSFTYLVPDPVYLPSSGPVETLLVRALLNGPSDWLAASVASQFPDGAQLGVGSVPLKGSTATVDLTPEALTGTNEERGRMAAQLTRTLTEITGISNVLAKAGGAFLLDEDPSNVSDFEMYDSGEILREASLYAVDASGVVEVSEEGKTPVPGALGQMPDVREVAVHPQRGEAVVIDSSGTQLLQSSLHERSDPELIYTGTELSSVSWDATGVVWAIDSQADRARLVALTRHGDVVPLTLTGQDGRDIEAVSVSPDGTRLALVVDGQAHVGIIKRGSGTVGAIEVQIPRRIGPDGTALDVAWASSETVAVLIAEDGDQARPYFADLSGAYSVEDPIPGAVALAGASHNDLVVETRDGRLLVGGDELASARDATYPG